MQFHHFGEEAYEETERAIQRLLGVDGEPVRVDAGGLAEAADWDALRSPETYVGYARGERRSDERADGLALNDWALTGDWSVGEEAAVLEAAAGSIAYRFQARDLNLVLTPPAAGAPVRFAVRLDGQPPGDAHGVDVDASGEGIVSEPRMYQLVRQRGAVASAPSRSRSSTPACAPTSSRSADQSSTSRSLRANASGWPAYPNSPPRPVPKTHRPRRAGRARSGCRRDRRAGSAGRPGR